MEYERCPARFGMAPADLTKLFAAVGGGSELS
jgi:hypothetical protein